MKKVAFLSCGRSDFSIYSPLIEALKKKKYKITVIAFGSHMSKTYGDSLADIKSKDIDKIIKIDQLNKKFSKKDISLSMSQTILQFSNIWAEYEFDLVFALGDRFEMFAAVASGVPFNIKFAHLHGGEKTLGAIDDVFRHSITHMSSLHLTSSKNHSTRVCELLGSENNIHNVGAIALHNIQKNSLEQRDSFLKRLEVPNDSFALVTIHPETVNLKINLALIKETLEALDKITINKLITLPNNDTNADVIRKNILSRKNKRDYFIFESLGKDGYYNALHNCEFMLGNSSSGLIESKFFKKNVINIGDRQLGRECNDNVIHIKPTKSGIIKAIQGLKSRLKTKSSKDVFYVKNAPEKAEQIISKFISKNTT